MSAGAVQTWQCYELSHPVVDSEELSGEIFSKSSSLGHLFLILEYFPIFSAHPIIERSRLASDLC